MELGASLKYYRRKAGLSQDIVAQKLNISRQAISQWENSKSYPDIDNLVLLAKLYDFDLNELAKNHEEIQERVDDTKQADEVLIKSEKDEIENNITNTQKDESILLLILSCLLFVVAPLGVIACPFILWRNSPNNKLWRLIIIVTIISLIYNLVIAGSAIGDLLNWGVTSYS